MADSVTSSSIYPSFVNAIQELDNIKGEFYSKFKSVNISVSADNTSVITHNLIYDSVHDDLLVFYKGYSLEKDENYIESSSISITLLDWTVSSGEVFTFRLYKNVK